MLQREDGPTDVKTEPNIAEMTCKPKTNGQDVPWAKGQADPDRISDHQSRCVRLVGCLLSCNDRIASAVGEIARTVLTLVWVPAEGYSAIEECRSCFLLLHNRGNPIA